MNTRVLGLILASSAFAHLASSAAVADDRQMVISIDDLPGNGAGSLEEEEEDTVRLLDVLKLHAVPAIGFVNERKLETDGAVDRSRVALLERWLDAGFELGNHGYAHLDLHKVEPTRWLADIPKGERVLRPLLLARGTAPRFFRHPYLHTGLDLEARARTTELLTQLGYAVAPVTIDNQEWRIAGAYARTRDEAEKRRLGEMYVEYMVAMLEFYEDQTLRIIGEAIPHVLLIHANALNAHWLDALLTRYEKHGYKFVPLEMALENSAYDSADEFTGSGGITWLHRWAITRGMPASTFAGEPELPAEFP
jgi:peptidoglycan/xylan/chitin deacetylase (PgdA/CDA1 family)